jgi:hypothetical protein
MAVIALMALLIASLAGLVIGRWRALLMALPAIPACALLLGPEGAALAMLATAGLAAGVHLHQLVAEHSLPRAG